MSHWIPYTIVFAIVVALTPLLAWAGVRLGSKAKGGVMLAAFMLGFGDALDQPAKQAVEATKPRKSSPENGEPPIA